MSEHSSVDHIELNSDHPESFELRCSKIRANIIETTNDSSERLDIYHKDPLNRITRAYLSEEDASYATELYGRCENALEVVCSDDDDLSRVKQLIAAFDKVELEVGPYFMIKSSRVYERSGIRNTVPVVMVQQRTMELLVIEDLMEDIKRAQGKYIEGDIVALSVQGWDSLVAVQKQLDEMKQANDNSNTGFYM